MTSAPWISDTAQQRRVQAPPAPGLKARGGGIYHQLHVLRGLAVLLVVMDHSCLAVSQHLAIGHTWIVLAWLAGFLGVTIFFVISGFIMVQTTQTASGTAHDAYAFLTRRVARIVPMYYLATAVALITTQVARPSSPGLSRLASLVCSLLFIPLLNARNLMEPILAQGWTLNYEVYFYLLFSVSLILPRRGRTLALVTTLAGSVVIGALFASDVHGVARAFKYLSAPIVLNFAFGMLLGKLRPSPVARPRPWQPVIIVIALIAVTMASVCWFSLSPDDGSSPFGWQAALAVYAAAAASCWLCVRQNQPLPRQGLQGVAARLAMLVGNASYTIYLFHLFVIEATGRLLILAGFTAFTTIIGCIMASMAVTVMIHLTVERPLNALLARRRRAAPGTAPGRAKLGERSVRPANLVQEPSYHTPATKKGTGH